MEILIGAAEDRNIFVGKGSITNIARHTTFATVFCLSESPIRQIGNKHCGRQHWVRSGLI
jgi:hypothetical protein